MAEEISECVQSLHDENDFPTYSVAVETLVKIVNNILQEPQNEKYRKISLGSKTFEEKLLPAAGAINLLFLMGFQEADEQLILPMEADLEAIRSFRIQLQHLKSKEEGQNAGSAQSCQASSVHSFGRSSVESASSAMAPMKLDFSLASETGFHEDLLSSFKRVLCYESPSLQEKTRNVIPVDELKKKALKNLPGLNADVLDEKPMDFQDCLLLELMRWFKQDFFKWYEPPVCSSCHKKMRSSGSKAPSEEERRWGAAVVEGYSCEVCKCEGRFPRYNDPGKLLETREGRCGEWANCFTLMCRALGFDARWVHDYTDHVWTEIFSQSQGRWIHVDPCENKMDTPLLYEAGWNKKLNYIIAFSKDEVVDVTWRYSLKHKEVCTRRKRCSESWLVKTLMKMNAERQSNFPATKRSFLERRLAMEVASFFAPPRAITEGERVGRSSGSLAWRLSRQETTCTFTSFKFVLTQDETKQKEFNVQYCTASDRYERRRAASKNGWQSCVYKAKNIFRKKEEDWKMVYLARTEGTEDGEISWYVDWTHSPLKASKIKVVFKHWLVETGKVDWQICIGDLCYPGNKDGLIEIEGSHLSSSKHLELSAYLSGGKGSCRWQHAQLFRQKEDEKESPLGIHIKFD